MLEVKVRADDPTFDVFEVSGTVADLDALAESARKVARDGQRIATAHPAGDLVLVRTSGALSLKRLTGSEIVSGDAAALETFAKAAEACAVSSASHDPRDTASHRRHLDFFEPLGQHRIGELILFAKRNEP